jgi:molybdopterin/thiamine biosynthesis adenylyltransferase
MSMLLVIIVVVSLGFILKLPLRLTVAALGVVYAGAVLAHLVLPPGNAIRIAVGGTLSGWLGAGALATLAGGYAWWVIRARTRAEAAQKTAPAAAPVRGSAFSEAELERYARHIVLREVGGPGQKKLKDAKVLVVGAGGLGSPALFYLAAAGVGNIGVIDDDTVANANLQRQIIHTDQRIGMAKVFSAEMSIRALNPYVSVRPYNRRLTSEIATQLFADYDLILDGSDNFDTRYLVNAAAVATGRPLIAGAIAQWEGQLSLYDPARGSPCYACVFPEAPAPGLAPPCAEAGVMGALPGVIGAMMAAEAIKEITGAGQGLRGRLQIYDALWGENRVLTVERRPGCAVCGDALDSAAKAHIVKQNQQGA